MDQNISFSFGQNWLDYISNAMNEESIRIAMEEKMQWLGNDIAGKTVLDIGCGSGLHSLAFLRLGASRIVSFDYDPLSVEAAKMLWEKAGRPLSWKICQGSILDEEFLAVLPESDIVYSWGVLHHTGAMWQAIENSMRFVKPSGYLWIAIYVAGPNYERDLRLKEKYNKAGHLKKRYMEYRHFIIKLMLKQLLRGQNPLDWNQQIDRGMDDMQRRSNRIALLWHSICREYT